MMAHPHRDCRASDLSLTDLALIDLESRVVEAVVRAPVVDAEAQPRSDQTKAVANRSWRQAFSCFQTFPSSQE
jgi:hypothetical protein